MQVSRRERKEITERVAFAEKKGEKSQTYEKQLQHLQCYDSHLSASECRLLRYEKGTRTAL